jgi:hypothetical protein
VRGAGTIKAGRGGFKVFSRDLKSCKCHCGGARIIHSSGQRGEQEAADRCAEHERGGGRTLSFPLGERVGGAEIWEGARDEVSSY